MQNSYLALASRLFLFTAILLSAACGDGGDASFKSIKGAKPANLSASEKNAFTTALSQGQTKAFDAQRSSNPPSSTATSAGKNLRVFGDRSLALADLQLMAAEKDQRSFKISDDSKCKISGRMALDGSGNMEQSGSEKAMKIKGNVNFKISANRCRNEQGIMHGTMNLGMLFDVDLETSGQPNSQTASTVAGQARSGVVKEATAVQQPSFAMSANFIIKMSGNLDGAGMNEKKKAEKHSVAFSDDFAVQIAFTKDQFKKMSELGQLTASDSSSAKAKAGSSVKKEREQTQKMIEEDILKCAGSVKIDDKSYDCTELMAKSAENAGEQDDWQMDAKDDEIQL